MSNKDIQNKEKGLIVRLTPEEHKQFKEYCEKNGYSMSKRLRLLITMDIKKHD